MSQIPDDLEQKIRAARDRQAASQPSSGKSLAEREGSPAGAALRVATDLVAALAVGGFMGYWLDEWLGTRPLFMVVLFFLGFAAGFLNIYRAQMGEDFKVGFKRAMPDKTDVNAETDNAKKD